MNERRRLTGVVISDKMTNTVVVQISRTYRHPLYRKVVHAKNKIYAHDELGSKIGDQVCVVETKPISRTKRWVVEAILTHNEAAASPIVEGEQA
ncbi:MAG: 30S ribosomal protein S17 [Anaerolineaceae bacterium]|jgi:small subunit ribosomal protein S17